MLRFAGYMFVLGVTMKAFHVPHVFMTILIVTAGTLVYQFVRYVMDLFTPPRYTYNPNLGSRTSGRYTPEFENNVLLNKRLNRQLFPNGMSTKQFDQVYAMQMLELNERSRRTREMNESRNDHNEMSQYWK